MKILIKLYLYRNEGIPVILGQTAEISNRSIPTLFKSEILLFPPPAIKMPWADTSGAQLVKKDAGTIAPRRNRL